jgi:hypothetical protein
MTTGGTPFQGGMIGRGQRDYNKDRGTTWPDCESEYDNRKLRANFKEEAQCPFLEIKITMQKFIVPERSQNYLYMIRVLCINEDGKGGLTKNFV